MERDDFENYPKKPRVSATQLAAGFVIAALFLTAFGVPLAQRYLGPQPIGYASQVDPITTASTPRTRQARQPKRYYVRRSVLQKNPEAECRIFLSGRREGDC